MKYFELVLLESTELYLCNKVEVLEELLIIGRPKCIEFLLTEVYNTFTKFQVKASKLPIHKNIRSELYSVMLNTVITAKMSFPRKSDIKV